MGKIDPKQADRQIRFVTQAAIGANLALFALKLVVGILGGSVSLVADAIHSVSDLATDFVVLLGNYFGTQQPDQSHPYGHGKIETFAAMVIAVLLGVVGGGMVYYATLDMATDKVSRPGGLVIVVAVISVVVKELLYRITRRTAVRTHSTTLSANAWHHRSDAFSSVAVVIGVAAMHFGFHHGDQVAAIAVGLMIIFVAVKILGDCVRELSEASLDDETVERIRGITRANPAIREAHRLRTRSVGREVFVDLHILVDPGLNIVEAHNISEELARTIENEMARPVNVMVHIEPDTPEMRRMDT